MGGGYFVDTIQGFWQISLEHTDFLQEMLMILLPKCNVKKLNFNSIKEQKFACLVIFMQAQSDRAFVAQIPHEKEQTCTSDCFGRT